MIVNVYYEDGIIMPKTKCESFKFNTKDLGKIYEHFIKTIGHKYIIAITFD